MNYIVMDLEWNQPLENQQLVNQNLPFEIIEIGAVKLNSAKEVISSFSEVVRPKVYGEMNYITRKLIHINNDELNNGKDFEEVIRSFLEWCGDEYRFCTWGTLDLGELQRNMDYYHITPLDTQPFPYYDVQKLFSIAYEDGKSRRSLEYAVDFLKLEKQEAFHRAYGDAYYTAIIFQLIRNEFALEKVSYDVYHTPKTQNEEVYVIFSNYAKYISREFDDKLAAMQDRQVSSMKCYLCNKNVKRKIKWFTPNGKHFYGIGQCDVHGMIKYKVRMKKTHDEHVYVAKTTKMISEKEYEEIKNKKERTRIQHRIKRKHDVDKNIT